jgi:hypothetical protein
METFTLMSETVLATVFVAEFDKVATRTQLQELHGNASLFEES